MNRARDAFRFRIELQGISPPVWREILVPVRYSFWDLHVAIQDSMGWLDCHLHEFRLHVEDRDEPVVVGIPTVEDDGLGYEVIPCWSVALADVLEEAGVQFLYIYDFGDDWVHTVALLGIEPREKGARYPRCVAGERACPPEDCGGPPGYQELLRVLFDPTDPEHREMREWLPRGWGPEVFKPGAVRFDNPGRRWKLAFEG